MVNIKREPCDKVRFLLKHHAIECSFFLELSTVFDHLRTCESCREFTGGFSDVLKDLTSVSPTIDESNTALPKGISAYARKKWTGQVGDTNGQNTFRPLTLRSFIVKAAAILVVSVVGFIAFRGFVGQDQIHTHITSESEHRVVDLALDSRDLEELRLLPGAHGAHPGVSMTAEMVSAFVFAGD